MEKFRITAFEKNGKLIIDEQFEASNDIEAKQIGEDKLQSISAFDKTHRCINSKGKLILFHP
jgi:hypothetical protein